jgi:Flp pilus assembly protein TadG
MQRPRSRRTPRAEDGAVLVIVALSLLAMFGMMVLVVDVGSLLYARRALVNAADAAALAAAQSCGQKEGT